MNGTIASVLRAPADEWPEILARESRHQARPMNDDVTVTLSRPECEALVAVLARLDLTVDSYASFRTLERDDVRAALRKLERASRGLSVVR